MKVRCGNVRYTRGMETTTTGDKPKKEGSVWWEAFFLAMTASLLTFIVMFAVSLPLAFLLTDSYETLLGSVWGKVAMTVLGCAILWLATWYQARFVRNRYIMTDLKKVALYAALMMVALSVLGFVMDMSEGYAWIWEDYAISALSIAVFYVAARKYLKG